MAKTSGISFNPDDWRVATISATDIDWRVNDLFTKDISSNTVFTFSNSYEGQTIIVRIKNTTGATLTATFPTAQWPNGVATADVGAGKSSFYSFTKIGSTIFATVVYDFS